MEPAPILSLDRVSRRFGPVEVLRDVDIALRPGEIHALIGENGAGKSTTMNILAGYLAPSSGRVLLDGAAMAFAGPGAAEAAGIAMIHQEFNLAEPLTVEENVFLGRELRRGPFLDRRRMRNLTRDWLDRLECPLDPRLRIADLSVSDKQMVEIAKALGRQARVLIMDEPTAVLSRRETEILLRLVARLRDEGTAILYTSHKLDEVARLSDRVTVLRDGAVVLSRPAGDLTQDRMAEAMVGRPMTDLFPPRTAAPAGAPVLEVAGLDVPGRVQDANLSVRAGEVLVLAGLVGAGRTELAEAVAGLRHSTGRVTVKGRPMPRNDARAARRAGLVYMTEDRKGRGLLLGKPLAENLTLLALDRFGRFRIDKRAEAAALDRAIRGHDIRVADPTVPAGALSGGNQQKLLLAKVLLDDPDIILIDEPTRGIDIGTKQQIYGVVRDLAQAGKAVIVVTSEMAEVVGLAHRVVVMRAGRIVGELSGAAIGDEAVVRLAMGLEPRGAAA